MKRLAVVPLAAFILTACQDVPTSTPESPQFEIWDAVHGGGNEHFYWLPPMITPMPAVSGVFDGAADPTVQICEGAISGCETPVITFSAASGLTVNALDEWYGADWYVFDQDPEVEVNDVFRISVSASGQELGFADLMIVDKVTGQLKKTLGGDYILLSEANGKKFLKIRFRIEEGALGLTIDATALSVNQFVIGGYGWQSNDAPVLLDLAPGVYGFHENAGGDFSFTVTPDGSIDYVVELDPILSGRGTNTLVVRGYDITIDATALSVSQVGFGGVGWVPTATPAQLTVLPSDKGIHENAGGDVGFTVTPEGIIDYGAELDPILAGRGTTTLVVRGYDITIDATALSVSQVGFGGVGWVPTATPAQLTVLPSDKGIHENAGGDVGFTVTPEGIIDYGAELDPILSGRGTTTLVVRGYDITIDATALSVTQFAYCGIGWLPTATPVQLTVLASDKCFSSTEISFAFVVIPSGTIDYDSSLDPNLSGRGTTTLTVTP